MGSKHQREELDRRVSNGFMSNNYMSKFT